jgi:hypothetical protein
MSSKRRPSAARGAVRARRALYAVNSATIVNVETVRAQIPDAIMF